MKRAQDLRKIEEAIRHLPALPPRPGLKEEMLAKVLAEVRRESLVVPPKHFVWKRPALGFSLSLAGLALSIVLLVYLLPQQAQQQASGTAATWHSGAAGLDSNRALDQELAQQKAQHEQELLRQVVPRKNGQYIGEGVEVTLSVNDPSTNRKSYLLGDVESDFDLLRLVQEIYDNGGQLVSINGILVKPYTQIVSHGVLTEVRDRRIQAPFLIKVIGDRELLDKTLHAPTSALMEIQKAKDLKIQIDSYEFVTIDPR